MEYIVYYLLGLAITAVITRWIFSIPTIVRHLEAHTQLLAGIAKQLSPEETDRIEEIKYRAFNNGDTSKKWKESHKMKHMS